MGAMEATEVRRANPVRIAGMGQPRLLGDPQPKIRYAVCPWHRTMATAESTTGMSIVSAPGVAWVDSKKTQRVTSWKNESRAKPMNTMVHKHSPAAGTVHSGKDLAKDPANHLIDARCERIVYATIKKCISWGIV